MKYRLCFVVTACAILLATGRGAAQQEFPFEIFGRYLVPLVQQIGMPGVSAAIIQTDPANPKAKPIIHQYNVGFADVERQIYAAYDTPYAIGGVTQAMTGVLHGACIDRFTGIFNVDAAMREFVPSFPFADATVRQVLAHAAERQFHYDAQLFSQLTPVIESPQCFNKPFRQAMAAEVLDRIPGGMLRSVPGMDLNRPEGEAARALFDEATLRRYQSVLNELAVPYRIDSKGRATRSDYPSYGLDAASGMVSTVEDLVNFETQLDRRDGVPFSAFTLDQMWSNQTFDLPVANGGTVRIVTPTGLGWFVTSNSNQPIIWSFGHIADASSALIVKLPKEGVTLIMLANSGGLAKNYDLENANVTSSPFVKVFLRLFIVGRQ
jgi:CubicO group peptidase (beta-lactamase class C family)